MDSPASLIRPILIVLCLAAPAISLRIASNYSDNPYLQPLDLTEEGLAAVGEGGERYGFTRIDVHVSWGRGWSGRTTQNQLRNQLVATLDQQTELYFVEIQDAPGDAIGITFTVGPNRYGPFPPSRMIDGLNSALIALRMTNRPNG